MVEHTFEEPEAEEDEDVREQVDERREAYLRCFQTPFGEEVLLDLYNYCRQGQTSFTGDPYWTAYHEGKRSVFLEILRTLDWEDRKVFEIARRKEA